jgi:hypothetical protein
MLVVVNHLHLRDPVTDTTVEAFREATQQTVAAGARAARVLKITDTHLTLLLDFRSPEDADRVSREIGGPWMRENIVPLLGPNTERSVGDVICSAQA